MTTVATIFCGFLAAFMLLSKGRTKPTLNDSACDFKEKAPDPMFKKIRSRFFRGEVRGESEGKKRKAPAVRGLMHRPVGVLKHRTLQPDTLWLSDIVFGKMSQVKVSALRPDAMLGKVGDQLGFRQ